MCLFFEVAASLA